MNNNILPSEHTPEHAKLSASGSHRWIRCAGSVEAEENIKEVKTQYATEGTKAHKLAERMFYNKDYSDLDPPEEMVEYVKVYINHLNNITTADNLLYITPGIPKVTYYIEKKVDYSNVLNFPDLQSFGTPDVIVINKKFPGTELHIADLKYGKGVRVEAKENTQLLLYAMGALNTLKDEIGIPHLIHLDIVQPRLNNISRWTITHDELKTWEGYMRAKGEAAIAPNAPRTPSEIACRWCRAFSTCKAPYELINKIPLQNQDLTDEEIRKILDNSKLIIKYLNTLEERVYDTLLSGKSFTGYKLVEGRLVRKLKEGAEEKLTELLGDEAYERKIHGILKLEKLLGKETLNSLTDYCHTKPVLVKDDDRRAPVEREELNFDAV